MFEDLRTKKNLRLSRLIICCDVVTAYSDDSTNNFETEIELHFLLKLRCLYSIIFIYINNTTPFYRNKQNNYLI